MNIDCTDPKDIQRAFEYFDRLIVGDRNWKTFQCERYAALLKHLALREHIEKDKPVWFSENK